MQCLVFKAVVLQLFLSTTQIHKSHCSYYSDSKLLSLLDYFGSSRPITRLLGVSTMKMSNNVHGRDQGQYGYTHWRTHTYIHNIKSLSMSICLFGATIIQQGTGIRAWNFGINVQMIMGSVMPNITKLVHQKGTEPHKAEITWGESHYLPWLPLLLCSVWSSSLGFRHNWALSIKSVWVKCVRLST